MIQRRWHGGGAHGVPGAHVRTNRVLGARPDTQRRTDLPPVPHGFPPVHVWDQMVEDANEIELVLLMRKYAPR